MLVTLTTGRYASAPAAARGDDIGEARRAAFRDDYACGAGGVGGADDGSQVVRIFDAVEHHVQAARGDRLVERRIFFGRAERDYALMIGAAGRPVQVLTRFETHGNRAFAAQFDDFLQARTGGAFDDQDPVEGTRGPQRFADGMDSRDGSHYDKGTLMSAHENLPVAPTLEIPDKLYFRIGDVARLAGIKPYVLRFWETEFPSLGPKKSGTGHRLYRRKDVELVLEIKRLLYDKRYTIEGARKFLEDRAKPEATRGGARGAARAAKAAASARVAQPALFGEADTSVLETVRKELRELAEMLK